MDTEEKVSATNLLLFIIFVDITLIVLYPREEGGAEESFCDPYWPLWIPCHALWTCQFPLRIPGIHKWGAPGVPLPGVRHDVSSMAQRTPALLQGWKVYIPPIINPVPGISYQWTRNKNGQGEGNGYQFLVHSSDQNYVSSRTTAPLLLHVLVCWKQVEVSVLDTSCCSRHEDSPWGVYVSFTPGPPGPTKALHYWRWCLYIWSWGCSVTAAGESSSTSFMSLVLLETIPAGAKLWHWESRTGHHQARFWEMEALAEGSPPTICGLYRSPQLWISLRGETSYRPWRHCFWKRFSVHFTCVEFFFFFFSLAAIFWIPPSKQRPNNGQNSRRKAVTSIPSVIATRTFETGSLPRLSTQNSLRQPSTDLIPVQCVLTYQPPLLSCSAESSGVPLVTHWIQVSERVWDSAHQHLRRAVRRHQHQHSLIITQHYKKSKSTQLHCLVSLVE